jgi:hypothetical protein
MLGNYRVASQLVASRSVLNSIELELVVKSDSTSFQTSSVQNVAQKSRKLVTS